MFIGLIVVYCICFYEELMMIYYNESYFVYFLEIVF